MSAVRRVFRFVKFVFRQQQRSFSVSSISCNGDERRSYRMVVVGGGTAGCAIGNKFGSYFGEGKVAVVEPSDVSL